jgi:hypothetical protein
MGKKNGSTHQSQRAACRCQAATEIEGSSLRLVSKVFLPPILEQKVLILTLSDWRRIMIMVEELSPISNAYQTAGSILAGMCISFLCLCFSFLVSPTVAGWLWVLGVSAACTSGVTSALCFLFHSHLAAARMLKGRSLSMELNQIGATFVETVETRND